MEKLNDYLKTLLSTCSFGLHLEPDKTPYVVSSNGATEAIAGAPLSGTQISTLIFPLIPISVKKELPNKPEIEFAHHNAVGNFNFLVKKSPGGFVVTIRPLPSEQTSNLESPTPEKILPTEDFQVNNLYSDFKISPSPISSFANSLPAEVFEPMSNDELPIEHNFSFDNENSFEAVRKSSDLPATNVKSATAQSSTRIENNFFDAPQVEVVSVVDSESIKDISSDSIFESSSGESEFAPPSTFVSEAQEFGQTPIAQKSAEQIQLPPQGAAFAPSKTNSQMSERMNALFRRMAEIGASDLHVSANMPPLVRKDGKMQKLESAEGLLTAEMTKELLTSIMPAKNQAEFARRHDTDFAYEIADLARFRANIFMDRKGMGGVFRIIPTKILTAEELGLSDAIMKLCDLSKGLVVVTGPTGSGKSTTLCAMVDSINKKREDHIITIEDPIEFTHENQKCLVNQREVHNHTDSFKDALRAALREDPDILLVGEMRDLETISIAIETAETGHLVFGTLHTTTAASTVDRIIDQFPADRQQQIRVMLSESLKGVIAQTLLPRKGGGRVAALEVLIITPAIANLIREGKTFQIPSAMQTGKVHGMVMLNDALFELVQKGLVEPRDAYIKAVDKTNFETLLNRSGMKI